MWEIVVGLEVHAQIASSSKLFSGASAVFGRQPNTQVSVIDAAFPGTLPVVNRYCIEQAVRTGLSLNARINRKSIFARKNYFYADLPAGYQISQYEQPIVESGSISIETPDGITRVIEIERLHLEQDAGKSLHDQHPTRSLIDLNRSGVGLMEIVSRPDLRSAEEAVAYVKKLRSILRYLGSCDGNMQNGSLRCDINISVRKKGEALRTRCEVKNVNSLKFIHQAIVNESCRQISIYEAGGDIKQETRLFDAVLGITRPMRTKEMAHDYRYFPDPDLLPLELDDALITKLYTTLPELPDQKKTRFTNTYGLSHYDANLLVEDRETADYYEVVANGRDPKVVANWILTNLFGLLNKHGLDIPHSPIPPQELGCLLDLVTRSVISNSLAKNVFETMFETGKSPEDIIAEQGLRQIGGGELESIIATVMTQNHDKVAQYQKGQKKMLGWFMGQIMKVTANKANPILLREMLERYLETSMR